MSAFRFIAVFLGVVILVGSLVSPAEAYHPQAVERARFVGQVTTVLGSGGTPSEFILQAINGVVDIHITPQTTFVAKSAEANVEGLARDDFAVVNVRRTQQGAWVAARITYDVDPFAPLRAVTASLTRVSLDGKRLLVKADTGASRWVSIVRLTRFRMDGRLLDAPPVFLKGQSLQLVVQNTFTGWVALEIDIRSMLLSQRG